MSVSCGVGGGERQTQLAADEHVRAVGEGDRVERALLDEQDRDAALADPARAPRRRCRRRAAPGRATARRGAARPARPRARGRSRAAAAGRPRAPRLAAAELLQHREEVVGDLERVATAVRAAGREPEAEVLLDRELAEDPPALRHERHACARDRLGALPPQRAPAQPDLAGRRRHDAHDRVQRRRLAGAVRADQADDLALVDAQAARRARRRRCRSAPRRRRARAPASGIVGRGRRSRPGRRPRRRGSRGSPPARPRRACGPGRARGSSRRRPSRAPCCGRSGGRRSRARRAASARPPRTRAPRPPAGPPPARPSARTTAPSPARARRRAAARPRARAPLPASPRRAPGSSSSSSRSARRRASREPAPTPSAATSTFSRTDRLPNDRLCWNVRASPARARRGALQPVISRPSSSTVPSSGRSNPVSTFTSVDLPAPFGPIRPTTSCWRTSSVTSLSACTPSKERETEEARSVSPGLLSTSVACAVSGTLAARASGRPSPSRCPTSFALLFWILITRYCRPKTVWSFGGEADRPAEHRDALELHQLVRQRRAVQRAVAPA